MFNLDPVSMCVRVDIQSDILKVLMDWYKYAAWSTHYFAFRDPNVDWEL